jgi:tryptophan-rich sensory protein
LVLSAVDITWHGSNWFDIVGLPFTPVVLLAIVVAWIFGYALGAYSAAMRFGRTKVPAGEAT